MARRRSPSKGPCTHGKCPMPIVLCQIIARHSDSQCQHPEEHKQFAHRSRKSITRQALIYPLTVASKSTSASRVSAAVAIMEQDEGT